VHRGLTCFVLHIMTTCKPSPGTVNPPISLSINDADLLIAAGAGKAYGYDLFTGTLKWTNNMDVRIAPLCNW
jgi:hypothetical protein